MSMIDREMESQTGKTRGLVLSVETLMAHEEFVRCVVRRILRDSGHEDDVVQGTWLRIMEGRSRTFDSVAGARTWLGRVSTNLARIPAEKD